uniref:Arginine/serine-rich protein PNISR n=2 Tax=Lygus hesperus TaxID=30085 RepID=A0A146M180_LYGHE
MWAGNNSDPQWGMNRMAFMNMPHEQVDWASLAQQWIKMKEEAPSSEKEEGGEAPMEITKEESMAPTSREHEWMASHAADASAAAWGGGGWGWDQAGAWMQWAGATPAGATPDMTAASGYTTGPGYTTLPQEHQPPVAPPAPVYPYNPPAQPPSAAVDSYTRGYWTSNPPTESVKNHHSWESSSSSRKKHATVVVPQPEPAPELDAAKRRALPAWIREGLEKMEREKQKKAEQERIQKLKKEGGLNLSPLNEEGGELTGANGDTIEALNKSKFDTDSEEDEEAPPPIKAAVESVPTPRRSRFDQSEPVSAPQLPPKPKFKSKEQILQTVMTDVRKILTQILMEVTTEEIEKAVEETHKQFKKKAPAATLRKTPALASLTGKLGLGIYESDSGSESEPEKVTNEPDSDQELRDRIDKLKNEFVRVEEDIEREATELEEKERIHLTRVNHQTHSPEDSSPSVVVVEDQVQLSREGSAASKSEKQILQKTNSEEARSNNGLEDNNRDSRSKDRRSSERKDKDRRSLERKDWRSSERKDRRSSERKDRRSVERRDRRSSERKDRRSSERSKSDKRSESSRSSSSESSSSSSSSEESSSPSPRRDKKHKRHHRHHHHRKDRKSRYSQSSSSKSKSRSRSRSRSRGAHRRRRQSSRKHSHSSTRSSHHRSDRKRRRSSSSSSDSSFKYRKTSHRR